MVHRGLVTGFEFLSIELGYGILISMLNIALHSIACVFLIRTMRSFRRREVKRGRMLLLALFMMAAGAALTFAHFVEVWIWAVAYHIVGAVDLEDAYYFAFVNFTTLGYGDILAKNGWRVLGPITAANGMLLFGASTALIFAVLTRAALLLHIYDERLPRAPRRPLRRPSLRRLRVPPVEMSDEV